LRLPATALDAEADGLRLKRAVGRRYHRASASGRRGDRTAV